MKTLQMNRKSLNYCNNNGRKSLKIPTGLSEDKDRQYNDQRKKTKDLQSTTHITTD
jgi:hypothetical protein